MKAEDLHVIAPISNPERYKVRYDLYRDFEIRMRNQGVNLYTVELAFGQRDFEVTENQNLNHTQFRSSFELWHKENMINLAIANLPTNWKYVAWIDTDVAFTRSDWAMETLHQLQHYDFVQMWQTAVDMGPSGEVLNTFNSAVWCYQNGKPYMTSNPSVHYGPSAKSFYWHPGFAWGARRSALEYVGGILDKMILGASDHHTCMALLGMGKRSVPEYMNKEYLDYVMRWQSLSDKYVRRNIGYVPGTILHFWHGKKSDRKYWDRWKVLKDGQFNPITDLKRDWQGLYQLVDDGTERSIILRDGIRNYFRARNENSIDL